MRSFSGAGVMGDSPWMRTISTVWWKPPQNFLLIDARFIAQDTQAMLWLNGENEMPCSMGLSGMTGPIYVQRDLGRRALSKSHRGIGVNLDASCLERFSKRFDVDVVVNLQEFDGFVVISLSVVEPHPGQEAGGITEVILERLTGKVVNDTTGKPGCEKLIR